MLKRGWLGRVLLGHIKQLPLPGFGSEPKDAGIATEVVITIVIDNNREEPYTNLYRERGTSGDNFI